MERKRPYSSDDVNNDGRPAVHSTGSGFALLSSDGWLQVTPYLDYYNNAMLRFASGALNRLVRRNASTLPLRVIAGLVVEYMDAQKLCQASAYQADLRTRWPDLVFEARASPESMLLNVLSKCKGFVVAQLELRDLPYNERVMDVVAQCLPFITVSGLFIDGIASEHDRVTRLLEVVRGLPSVSFKNDADHPNSAPVLSVCAARKFPGVSLRYAVDVTEAQMLDFLFNNSSATTTRQLGIVSLRQSISDNFFERIVERCRRNECKSLRFGMFGILTDPTDAKYSRFVVERDETAAMYKFDAVGQTDLPFTILVGKSKRFFLKVFQGSVNELCTSIDATRKICTYRM